MSEEQGNEVLKKLEQGIQESREMIQQRVMELAQDYFTGSVEMVKQAMEESRSTLEGLPDQLPGADEGSFRMLFENLMNNYDSIEECLDAAQQRVENLDPEEIVEQGEVDATDASRREAVKLGVDLSEVRGTGSGGRIIISDIMEAAEKNAKNKARELGVNVEEVEGSGFNGLVTADDVVQFAESRGDDVAQIEAEPTVDEAEPMVKIVEVVEEEAQPTMEAEAVQIAEEGEALKAAEAEVARTVGRRGLASGNRG